MDDLRYQALTYKLRGAIFEAHNTLRIGWSEEVYHQGMLEVLASQQIPVVSKPRRAIVHRGVEVHTFEADLITWDAIILELKVLPFGTFAPGHKAQLIHYLKCWGKDLGLLVNFGAIRARIERFVWDEPELRIHEDYEAIALHLNEAERKLLHEVRSGILDAARQYGLGYPDTLYRKILAVEAAYRGLECQQDVIVPCYVGRPRPGVSTERAPAGGRDLSDQRACNVGAPIGLRLCPHEDLSECFAPQDWSAGELWQTRITDFRCKPKVRCCTE
jgi:GxxExxY protein